MIIGPRPGHIDMEGDMAECHVGVSVESRIDGNGQVISLLHLDVARGDEIDSPFSVGIPLSDIDVLVLVQALGGSIGADMRRTTAADRLN